MQETWVWSLGWEDPLEKGMATHSSILAWRIPWTEEPGGLQSTGSQRVGHDWATSLSLSFTFEGLLILWPQVTSTRSLCNTKWYLLSKKAWDFTNCKPLELGVSLLIHSSLPWPFLFTLSTFLRLFAFSDITFLQYEMMKVDKRKDYTKKKNAKEQESKARRNSSSNLFLCESLRSP